MQVLFFSPRTEILRDQRRKGWVGCRTEIVVPEPNHAVLAKVGCIGRRVGWLRRRVGERKSVATRGVQPAYQRRRPVRVGGASRTFCRNLPVRAVVFGARLEDLVS